MKKLLFAAMALILVLGLAPSAVAQEGVYFRTWGGWDAPPAWHGNHYQSGCCGVAWWFIWEPLFHYVPGDDSIIMRLAKSYELSEDGMVSTVVLQDGSAWNDGTPATAQDVWDSFAFEKSWDASVWAFLDSIEIVDDMTVKFHWKQPTPIARQLLAGIQIRAPHHLYGEWAQALWDAGDDDAALSAVWDQIAEFRPEMPIGTGPFYVDSVTESVFIMKKFEGHPFAANVAFDGVRVERDVSNEATWNLLQAGELDAAHPGSPPDVVDAIAALPDMEYVVVSDLSEFSIYFNPTKYDAALRKAIAQAINRTEMREVSFYYAVDVNDYAHGVLKTMEDLWLGADWIAENLTSYAYDPEAAAAALQALGYTKDGNTWKTPAGEDFAITAGAPSGWSDWVYACENLAQQFSNFGIVSECQPRDNAVYWTDQTSDNFDIDIGWFATYWGTGHPYTGYEGMFNPQAARAQEMGADVTAAGEFAAVDGTMVTPLDLTAQLGQATTFEEQQAIVRDLAYITNENLFALPYLEKSLGIYRNGAKIQGWPAADDPMWTMCGGGIERFYTTLMVTGAITPK